MPEPTNGEGHVDELDESQTLEDDDVVTFTDEDGNEHRCAVLAIAEVEGRDFALLAPVDQLDDEDEDEALELFIFAYGEDDEGLETFSYVEDEALYDRVKDFFSTLVEEGEE